MARTAPTPGDIPAANRQRPPGWRDPRLVLGVVVVAGCVVLGSLLFAASDSTVLLWGVRRDAPAGLALTSADLVERRVRLAGSGTTAYLRVGSGSPAGKVLARAVGAGELLPAAAIAGAAPLDVVEVPLEIAVGDLPTTLRPGDRVDLWSVPKGSGATGDTETPGADGDAGAHRLLTGVLVIGLPGGSDPLAPTTTRAVLVEVPAADDLAGLLGATADSRIVLTHRRGGQ
ncbi:MAG TPA: hypothetical protein VHZ06_00915 [Marmoricola sp.]|nr:hypothetical protein [Marmoricola sp.]